MADEIRADYNQLEDIASRFGNQSQAVNDTLQSVRTSMGPLEDGGWIGRAADSFFDEMQAEVIPAVQRLLENLAEANRAVRDIAETMRQAETEASGLFRNQL